MPVYHRGYRTVNNKNTRYCGIFSTFCIVFSIYCCMKTRKKRPFSTEKPPQTLDLTGFAGVITGRDNTFTGGGILWCHFVTATISCGGHCCPPSRVGADLFQLNRAALCGKGKQVIVSVALGIGAEDAAIGGGVVNIGEDVLALPLLQGGEGVQSFVR